MKKLIRRNAAVAAFCCSTLTFAAPPAAAPAPAPAKVAAAPAAAEYPLSCIPAAKPLFARAMDQLTNSRRDEARETFKQTIAADPKCVVAKAHLAGLTPGAEGKTMFTEVMTQLTGLTEVERTQVEAMDARRNGEFEKAFTLVQKAATIAPTVFLVQMDLIIAARDVEKFDVMRAAATRATELSPKTGAGWNLLGYAALNQNKNDDAIAAFRKYAEVAPTEPNAHDSLADALLANNQLDEAAAEYQKAIDTRFWLSWSGIATVKALKGDFAGARTAIDSMKAGATDATDKLATNQLTAWSWLAQGKLADALKVVDASEKEAMTAKLDWAVARHALLRGTLQLAAGKSADALKTFTTAQKAKTDALTDGQKNMHRAMTLAGLIEAQARLGKTADAEKNLAAMETLFKTSLSGPMANDAMALGRGAVAMSKKDLKGAVEAFKKCSDQADLCRLMLADVQDKAGDATGATETRVALQKANHREGDYWFVRAQVDAKLKVPGKKVATDDKQ